MSTFVPIQALPASASLVTYISGDITEKIASKLLGLLPPIDIGASVHDNAYGSGTITRAIMSSRSPSKCRLYATDINPSMISELKAEASAKGWPVLADVMPAQRLTFQNDMFSHSTNSFSIQLIEEDAEVVKQVFRTLQPGRAALFSFWKEPILARAVLAAHQATRRAGTSTLPALRRADFDVEAMRKSLERRDFGSDGHIWNEVQESLLVDDLEKWPTAA